MKKANIYVSIVILMFAGFYAYLTTKLPERNLPNTLGIDFMPWLLVSILSLLSIWLLLQNVLNKSRETFDPKVSIKEGLGVLLLTVLVYAYVKAMELFGFVWITPIFLGLLMVITGSRKWKEIVVVSIVSSLCIYVFFQKIFIVILPSGRVF